MSERDEFGAFLVGFLVGALTGAVTALLLAPQTGEETRTLIRDKAIELKEKAGETVDDAYVQAEKAALDARTRFDELAKVTRERAGELGHRGQVLLEEQKARFSEVLPVVKKKAAAVTKPPEGGEAPATE